MGDLIHKTMKWLDHNRYTAIGVIVALTMVSYSVGCQAKAPSPLTGQTVTRAQLNIDVATVQADIESQFAALQAKAKALQASAKSAYDEIERQEAIVSGLINTVASLASTYGGPSGQAVAATVLSLSGLVFGVGATADNRRKDRLIKKNSGVPAAQ